MAIAEERRLRLLQISPEFLEKMIKKFSEEPLPPDLMMISAMYDSLRARFVLVFQSKEFDSVPMGTPPPFWNVVCAYPSPDWEQVRDEIKSAIDLLKDNMPVDTDGTVLQDQVLHHLANAHEGMAVTKPCGDDAGLPEGTEQGTGL